MNLKEICFMIDAHIALFDNEGIFLITYEEENKARVKEIHESIIALTFSALIESNLVASTANIGEAGLNAAMEKAGKCTINELEIAPFHYAINAFDKAYGASYSNNVLERLYTVCLACMELFSYSHFTQEELIKRLVEAYPNDEAPMRRLGSPEVRRRIASFSDSKENKVSKSSTASSSASNASASAGGGCYIATCAYGSYDCPEVWTLRRFRDQFLANRRWGRAFIRAYYAISPRLVERFGGIECLRSGARICLDKFVLACQKHGYENTPYCD